MAETKQAQPAAVAEEPNALQRINTMIEKYRTQQFNILCPAVIQEIPEWFSIALKVVQVDPNPDHRQVYKATPGSDDLSFGKVPLSNLASAAGISWSWAASGRSDDGRDPNITRYRMVGTIVDLSGERRTLMAEKEINLVAIQAELWRNYEKKAKTYEQYIPAEKKKRMLREDEIQEWVREKVLNDLIQMKKHALARAQTGAMERVVRDALGLKSSYTPAELAKPFVVPRLIFTPDTNDPDVKMFHLALKSGVIEELYGKRDLRPLSPLHIGHDTKTGDIIDMTTGMVMDEGQEIGEPKSLTTDKITNGGTLGKPAGAGGSPPVGAGSATPSASGEADDLPLFREEGAAQETPPPNPFEVKWNEAQTREAKEKVLQELLVKKGKKESELNKGNLKSYSDKGLQSIFDFLFKAADA